MQKMCRFMEYNSPHCSLGLATPAENVSKSAAVCSKGTRKALLEGILMTCCYNLWSQTFQQRPSCDSLGSAGLAQQSIFQAGNSPPNENVGVWETQMVFHNERIKKAG